MGLRCPALSLWVENIKHYGIYTTWMNGVNTNPILRVLDRRRLRNQTHCTFSAVICCCHAGTDEPSNRRDIDNRPPTSVSHCWNSHLHPEPHSGLVYRHDTIPQFHRSRFDAFDGKNPRVIH